MRETKGLKKRERALLVAQLVYQEAVTRHRAERTELTRRMVAEAQEHLARVRRHAMLAAWGQPEPPIVTCPRCGDSPRTTTWQDPALAEDAPLEDATASPNDDPMWNDVPDWASRYVREGVDSVTRYHCDRCHFEIAMLGRQSA